MHTIDFGRKRSEAELIRFNFAGQAKCIKGAAMIAVFKANDGRSFFRIAGNLDCIFDGFGPAFGYLQDIQFFLHFAQMNDDISGLGNRRVGEPRITIGDNVLAVL